MKDRETCLQLDVNAYECAANYNVYLTFRNKSGMLKITINMTFPEHQRMQTKIAGKKCFIMQNRKTTDFSVLIIRYHVSGTAPNMLHSECNYKGQEVCHVCSKAM